jgi:hypothetical protein
MYGRRRTCRIKIVKKPSVGSDQARRMAAAAGDRTTTERLTELIDELEGKLRTVDGFESFKMTQKIKEHTCDACNGTGFPVVKQPAQPGRKIYPLRCETCDGKGKITDAN